MARATAAASPLLTRSLRLATMRFSTQKAQKSVHKKHKRLCAFCGQVLFVPFVVSSFCAFVISSFCAFCDQFFLCLLWSVLFVPFVVSSFCAFCGQVLLVKFFVPFVAKVIAAARAR